MFVFFLQRGGNRDPKWLKVKLFVSGLIKGNGTTENLHQTHQLYWIGLNCTSVGQSVQWSFQTDQRPHALIVHQCSIPNFTDATAINLQNYFIITWLEYNLIKCSHL
jgi:hypothetical protein